MTALLLLFLLNLVGLGQGTFVSDFIFGPNHEHLQVMTADSALVELFVGEYIRRFSFKGTWLDYVKDRSEFANFSTIHMAALGVRPNVLVNNVTYPIPTVDFSDEDILLNMDKFDTENTFISDDILFSSNLDKIGAATEDHRESIQRAMTRKGLHAIAPTSFNASNFMQPTSGAVADGFKKAQFKDFIDARLKLYATEVVGDSPLHVILTPEHERDLLEVDNNFKDKYNNTRTGEIFDYMGFKFHKDVYKVWYNSAGTTKKAWGAAPVAGDRYGSVIFPEDRVVKAMGGVKMFRRLAVDDPENRGTTIGFRRYGLVLPTKVEGFATVLATP